MYDVAIVGFGPTGATLANLLAAQGVSVLIIEREPEMYHLPRAVHFDDEVMRVFQTVGIANDLTEKVRVNPGMKFVDDQDQLLLDWPRPQETTQHGWNASYRLHQPDLEILLRQKLALESTATVLTNIDVETIRDEGDHVVISGIDRQSRKQQTYDAQYVVGCDGANSVVHRLIGGGMEDFSFHERWLVIDVILKHSRPDLGDHSIQFCNPERPMTYCRSPGSRRRWEIKLHAHESDSEMIDVRNVWSLLSRWISPEDATLERSTVYTFHSKVARQWRENRMLIAGDAAHLTPPFMGQGMCTGIRDAANLAWKLATVVQHSDHASLLDTYQVERAPHAKSYVQTAIKLGGLINSLERDSALALADNSEKNNGQMRSIAPKLGQSSILAVSDDDGSDDAELSTGRPFPQFCLEPNKTLLDDTIGYRHLVVSSEPMPSLSAQVVWLDASKQPAISCILEQAKAGAVWVRPDRYIGAMAPTVEKLAINEIPFLNV